MSKLYNSKEVYKRIPKVKPKDNPLRAVRGMYISGDYRPIYWIDTSIHISSIDTIKATVTDLGTAYSDTFDDSILKIIEITPQINLFTDYTQSSGKTFDDNILNIIEINPQQNSIYSYTRSDIGTFDDSILKIIEIQPNNVTLTQMHNERVSGIEPMICITNISTNIATVSVR